MNEVGGRVDGQTESQMNGYMDGWIDGRIPSILVFLEFSIIIAASLFLP